MNYKSRSSIYGHRNVSRKWFVLEKIVSLNVIKFGLEAHILRTGIIGVFMPYSLRLIGT